MIICSLMYRNNDNSYDPDRIIIEGEEIIYFDYSVFKEMVNRWEELNKTGTIEIK